MSIGIVGGGLMGLSLAYFLSQQGEQVTVLEQSAELGGLSGEVTFNDGLAVARYQHAILPQDYAIRQLCHQLGLASELIFRDVRTGFIHDNVLYPLSNIADFMTFAPLSPPSRVRLGLALLQARRERNWQALDALTVKAWLLRIGGSETFERIWRPLLEAKFDSLYDQVPATFVWAWMNRMMAIRRAPDLKGKVGYLKRGHYALIRALAEAVEARGGHIETLARVREIEVHTGAVGLVRTHSQTYRFDVVIAAVPTPVFSHLIPGADDDYLQTLANDRYLGLICPMLVLDRPLTGYWTLNIIDPNSPFSSIIETPHPEWEGRHIVYLPRYTASDNDWMGVSDGDILSAWLEHLQRIFPHFDTHQIQHQAVSRSRYVEPIYGVNAARSIRQPETPYQNLYLANTTLVYPELPTSESVVVFAQRLAQSIRGRQPARVALAS